MAGGKSFEASLPYIWSQKREAREAAFGCCGNTRKKEKQSSLPFTRYLIRSSVSESKKCTLFISIASSMVSPPLISVRESTLATKS